MNFRIETADLEARERRKLNNSLNMVIRLTKNVLLYKNESAKKFARVVDEQHYG